ncbi:MAG: nuclear transport factor 2 family protein [Candidatus Protistobacter heckmanni]|nr:nuclear transport factor 2 family protein [Candidatus Protistobacter heckmanni]
MPRFARLFEAADDVLDAYREAMRRRDPEAALQLWLDEDSVSCVLPGGQRVSGLAALRDAVNRLLSERVIWIEAISTVSHSSLGVFIFEAIEALRFDENATEANLFVHTTYVLLQNHEGWRIAHVHCSEASSVEAELSSMQALH